MRTRRRPGPRASCCARRGQARWRPRRAASPSRRLVTPASAPDRSLLMLLSALSDHTRQLRAEPRCALHGHRDGDRSQPADRAADRPRPARPSPNPTPRRRPAGSHCIPMPPSMPASGTSPSGGSPAGRPVRRRFRPRRPVGPAPISHPTPRPLPAARGGAGHPRALQCGPCRLHGPARRRGRRCRDGLADGGLRRRWVRPGPARSDRPCRLVRSGRRRRRRACALVQTASRLTGAGARLRRP